MKNYFPKEIPDNHYTKVDRRASYTKVDGGAGRDRTDDLKLAKLPLSQLSYAPRNLGMVGLGRLELPTSRLSGVRSNHLSYRPIRAVARVTKTKRYEDSLI